MVKVAGLEIANQLCPNCKSKMFIRACPCWLRRKKWKRCAKCIRCGRQIGIGR